MNGQLKLNKKDIIKKIIDENSKNNCSLDIGTIRTHTISIIKKI